MSALGQKRTFAVQSPCPLYPQSGHVQRTSPCPLCAKSGTYALQHDWYKKKDHRRGGLSEIQSGILIRLREQQLPSVSCASRAHLARRDRWRKAGERPGGVSRKRSRSRMILLRTQKLENRHPPIESWRPHPLMQKKSVFRQCGESPVKAKIRKQMTKDT